MLEELSIISTAELKGGFKASLYDNSIIEVKLDPELKEVEKFYMVELTKAIKLLGNAIKMCMYYTV